MAEQTGAAFGQSPVFLSGQSAEISSPKNPARTLTTASCRVTSLQPIAQSIRLQNSGTRRARGSRATNNFARWK
jgi:hypothetical protein